MPTARGSRWRFAGGKQTAEGTLQATPAFEVSLYDGSIEPVNVENPHEAADVEDLPIGSWIESAASGGDPVVSSDASSAPFWWFLLLGADVVTGAADKTHTITRSYTKPLWTPYQMRPGIVGGSDLWERSGDNFLKGIELRAPKGKPLQHALMTIGKSHELSVLAPTPTNDKRIKRSGVPPLLTHLGSTVKLELDTTPAVAQIRTSENIVIRAEYPEAEWVQTDELQPRYLDLGPFSLTVTVDIIVQDYQWYAATFWGTKTIAAAATPGMALSPVVVLGSMDCLFPVGPVVDANRSLQIQKPALRFRGTPPKPAPDGKAQKATLVGTMYQPASGEPITVIGKNEIVSY